MREIETDFYEARDQFYEQERESMDRALLASLYEIVNRAIYKGQYYPSEQPSNIPSLGE